MQFFFSFFFSVLSLFFSQIFKFFVFIYCNSLPLISDPAPSNVYVIADYNDFCTFFRFNVPPSLFLKISCTNSVLYFIHAFFFSCSILQSCAWIICIIFFVVVNIYVIFLLIAGFPSIITFFLVHLSVQGKWKFEI